MVGVLSVVVLDFHIDALDTPSALQIQRTDKIVQDFPFLLPLSQTIFQRLH